MNGVVIKNEGKAILCGEYLDEYLRQILKLCDKVHLFSSSTYSSEAPMCNLYVSMPTNVCIDIEVNTNQVINIWETISEDKKLDRHVSVENIHIKYNDNIKHKLVNKLTNLVNQGKEYFYPNAEDRPLIISPPWNDGIKENYWILSVFDIVSIYDQVVLLGEPGSGKSTTLRHLAVALINNHFNKIDTQIEISLSNYLYDNNYIPIYIEVRDFSKWLDINKRKNINIAEIKDYIKEFLKNIEDENAIEIIWNYIRENRVIFIFDGLDEIYSKNAEYLITREKLSGVVRQINGEIRGAKILFSSRIGEYIDYELPNFKKIKLRSMNRHNIQELIAKTYCYNSVKITKEQISEFVEEMNEKGLNEDIVGNPLLLSLIIAIAMNNFGVKNRLPNEKSQILYEGIKLLIERWYSDEALPTFFETYTSDEILQRLKLFAYNTNENGLISFKELFIFLKADKNNSTEILDYLVRRAGLIIQKGEEYEFAHKSFRSYLAASYIVESEDCLKYLTTNNRNNFLRQHETTSLAIDILFDKIKEIKGNDNSVAMLWNIINLLIDTGENEWDIWLAGKILSTRNYLLLDTKIRFQDEIINLLKEKLLQVFLLKDDYTHQDLDMYKRIECGIVLGKLGDMRSGVGICNGIPEIEWCDIQGGRFEYGIKESTINKIRKTQWGKDCVFTRELPMQEVDVQHFQISKYPITVLQFKSFLEDEQGYYSYKWYDWSDVAEKFYFEHINNKLFDLNDKHDIDNYPMTYVSFIEAVAFCKWLSMKTNCNIRLPSEVEWEYVAKMQNEIFTWGDEYSSEQCNGLSTNIGSVCPVGSFFLPQAELPVDMCGNTWEWTQTYYTEDHREDKVNTIININHNEQIKKEYLIADCGGSFLNGPNCMRTSFRGRDPVDARADRHGFRIVRSKECFKGKIEEKPCFQQVGMTCDSKVCEREGYGPVVERNDNILIWYELYNEKTNQYIERGVKYRFVLGSGKIHKFLEDMLIGKRVASFFIVRVQARECFGNKTFGNLRLSDMLRFEISIMDVVE